MPDVDPDDATFPGAVATFPAWDGDDEMDDVDHAGGHNDERAEILAIETYLAPEDWRYVGTVGEPAFENGWSNLTGQAQLSFRKIGNRVFLGGVTWKGGVADVDTDPIFTLPAGYRPSTTVLTAIALGSPVDGRYNGLTVSTAGVVSLIPSDFTDWKIVAIPLGMSEFPLDPPELAA